MQRSIKQEVNQWQINLQSCLTAYGERRLTHKNLNHCLYKQKGNAQVCDNHRGIFSSSIAGKIPLNRINEHLDQTRFLPESQCGFRKDRGTIDSKPVKNKCKHLHDLCRPYQSIWSSQSWWAFENYGKVWLSSQVHSSGEAILLGHACMGPERWRVLWTVYCNKWSRARLCAGTDTVQHDVLCHFRTVMMDFQSDTALLASCSA